jgi:hypothetical protein
MIAAQDTSMISDEDRRRAEKGFKQELRARGVRKVMTEYEARAREIRQKTERLRALRLAKEAQEQKSKGDK